MILVDCIFTERNNHMMKNLEQSKSAPLESMILDYLRPRMNASTAQTNRWHNLQKGHAGESHLHHLLRKELPPRYLLLSDLLLEHQHTKFQIDLLLMSNNAVYLLEVKNYYFQIKK